MKPVTRLFIIAVSVLMLASCDKVQHKKTPGGMAYQLYSGKGSTPIRTGYVVKLNFTQKIKDSTYFTTRGKMPIYWPVSGQTTPYDISELWDKLRKGDSVIATQLMDTFIKRNPTGIPPEFKKGDRIVSTIKILDVFTTDSLARIDEEKEKQNWLVGEIDFVQKYLANKKINAQKTPSGAFVEIINPGTGDLITAGKSVSIMYKGTSFSGKTFDTNLDSSFHHTDPMVYTVGTQMIKGFDEPMHFLRKGAEANLYVPSMLGYGARPSSPDIQPFEHLIFYVKILDVKDAPPPPPQAGKVDVPQRK